MVNGCAIPFVRHTGNAKRDRISHPVNMSRARTARSLETLSDLRRTSGWWLAAWRDYRKLSQDEVAAETGIKKSALSELENGRVRKDGRKPRFNRDTIVSLANALGITEGMLFDVNPYEANPQWMAQFDALRQQGGQGPASALELVEALPTRRRA